MGRWLIVAGLAVGLAGGQAWDQDQVVAAWEFSRDADGWQAQHSLAPLVWADGLVRTAVTGDDPYLAAPALDLDADAISHVVLRMRSTRGGHNQIYFATDTAPNPAVNGVPQVYCPGDNRWHVQTVRLSGAAGWGGRLRFFRLDPVNGPARDAAIEIDYIRLIRLAPKLGLDSFAADRAWARPGTPVTLRLSLRNIGGGTLPPVRVSLHRLGDGPPVEAAAAVDAEPTPDGVTAQWTVTLGEAPLETYLAQATVDGRPAARTLCGILTVAPEDLPRPGSPGRGRREGRWWTIGTARTHLALLPGPGGWVAGVLRGRVDGTWRIAGVVSPLSQLLGRFDGGAMEPVDAAEMSIRNGQLIARLGTRTLRREIALAVGEREGVEVTTTVFGPGPVTRVSGPTLLAGEGAWGADFDGALFPGLEYLDAGQRSSDTASVGETRGLRLTPSPIEITVPLMAVEQDGLVCGLMWNALEPWDGEHPLPTAEFAAPNFASRQANSHLALFAPNSETGVAVNARQADPPLELPDGGRITLRCRLFAVPGGTVDAVPLWYATYGQPDPPRLVKPLEAVLADLIRGWAETCYTPASDGFVNHWRFGQAPTPNPGLKATILGHALETGDRRWADAVGLPADATLAGVLGPLDAGFDSPTPPPALATQRADGTWGYTCPPGVRDLCEQFTSGARHSLGVEGQTNIGLCATQAVTVLNHAVTFGDAASREAGLRALAAMESFDVPAGSQTWEVHADIPDIYAAALAADCFRLGYRLTGEARYLKRARYWARTGLPFLYAYRVPGTGPGAMVNVPGDGATEGADPFEGAHPAADVFEDPDRHPTPYGSIPVFGTSFYVVNWFGTLVQWCGLRWAGSTLELLELLDDPVLERAAVGVLHSGCLQTFDKPPVVGLLPDVYSLGGNSIHPAFIGPGVVEPPLRRWLDRPAATAQESLVLTDGGGPVHLTVRGWIERATLDRGELRFRVRYVAGQASEAVVHGLPAPARVRVGGRELPRVEDYADEGWRLVDGRLWLRARHREAVEEIRLSP